jgi:hypothetical protein
MIPTVFSHKRQRQAAGKRHRAYTKRRPAAPPTILLERDHFRWEHRNPVPALDPLLVARSPPSRGQALQETGYQPRVREAMLFLIALLTLTD